MRAKTDGNKGQGMNWCRKSTRLAIYVRDGLACVWCGATVEDDTLTLDHFLPRSKGGDNAHTNLVTACRRCNSSRGNRPAAVFARVVAEYRNHGLTADDVMAHVRRCRSRKISTTYANALIARRGFTAACKLDNA